MLTKFEAGTLILSGANTYSGTTLIAGGTLKLGASSSSGTEGPLGSAAGITTVNGGFSLDLNGYSLTGSATEPLTINGTGVGSMGALTNSSGTSSSYAGSITVFTAASIVGANGAIDITGSSLIMNNGLTLGGTAGGSVSAVISGGATLTKDGTGIWTLAGANIFSGITQIIEGTLKLGISSDISNSGPLGSSFGITRVAPTPPKTASLDLNGFSLTGGATEPLFLSYTGVGGSGALKNSSTQSSTFAGLITRFQAATSIVTDAGDILITNTGISSGNFLLTLGGSANGNISSIIAGTGGLTKTGTGTWTLSAANTYSGQTSI